MGLERSGGTYCEVPVPLPEVTIFSSAPPLAAALEPLPPLPSAMAEAVDASAASEEILVDAAAAAAAAPESAAAAATDCELAVCEAKCEGMS